MDPNFSSKPEDEVVTQLLNSNINNPNNPTVVCANDTNFGDLWGLQNPSNPGIDINVCNAWTITEGAGVKVAVFDTGIDLTNQDLSANILPLSYDAVTSSSPSQTYNIHGTNVAGVLGAIKNNNYQIVGVAPKSKMYSISINFSATSSGIEQTTRGINWAVQNGADIINNSWQVNYVSSMLDDAISNALTFGRNGLGTVILFAAGNAPKPQNPNSFGITYPANTNDKIIVVGSIGKNGIRAFDSCYGGKLDIVAPGVDILMTSYNNTLLYRSGTSFATPHVAGIAALILSVNPYLNVTQVSDIIEKTAKKLTNYTYTSANGRPNGTWNEETGYGLVDAYEAVKLAQQMDSPTLDLYVKDSSDDFGIEPNTTTPYMWASDNMWVRNSNDNGTEHQNPVYNSNNTPNYVKIRVINKSRVPSTGNERLKLYWAKASTGLSYPNPWNGGVFHPTTGAPMGNPVGSVSIPVLQPGQETILSFPWIVPNPANYNNEDQWHFCLLTRIESVDDPMTVAETTDLNANVRNNNNIAWKNVTVVDLIPGITPGGVVAIGNPFSVQKNYKIEFLVDDVETGKPVFQEAEVGITMDDTLYNAWQRGGNTSQSLAPTSNQNKKLVSGNNAILGNVSFNANETGLLRLDFNFLTREATDKQKFRYHVIQKDAVSGQIIGGETFMINKDQRALFMADAGSLRMVNENESLTINAADIQEPATYNWYDSSGNLIYQGQNLQILNAIAENYKLEVISNLDGFKDYAQVEVRLNPSRIQTIAPNPASNNIQVNYILNAATSAYIIIIGNNNSGVSNNYIIDTNSSQHNINISNYPAGFYTVALIVNGEVADAKTLIKQ
ncbi:S8 family peptidase [Chryseobacterium koreense]|uniref:S8 family peptidase n=1 Tax=Chryseobacterium koreense TaxID=232216 RepID=UPI00069D00E6|nr:S8 family serine peptidase [Chryseobacterium koreense]MBB5334633.1 hypothetical protein [Chryseobacterium koreense]